MAVVVQQLVVPRAAGVLFTADPVSGHRKVTTIEATFGLGEALVSGAVNPDVYAVCDGNITSTTIATKAVATRPQPGGGTREEPLDPARQQQAVLSEAEVVQLERLGRTIEAHFGRPQDIEWCFAGDELFVVQSRPITTLYPIPMVDDDAPHVYVSVGAQQ